MNGEQFWPEPKDVPLCWFLALVIAVEVSILVGQLLRHHA